MGVGLKIIIISYAFPIIKMVHLAELNFSLLLQKRLLDVMQAITVDGGVEIP